MIKKKSVFETPDGKTHLSMEAAKEHLTNSVREYFSGQLAGMTEAGRFSATERYRTIMALFPDYEATESTFNAMSLIFGAGVRIENGPKEDEEGN